MHAMHLWQVKKVAEFEVSLRLLQRSGLHTASRGVAPDRRWWLHVGKGVTVLGGVRFAPLLQMARDDRYVWRSHG